jgi:hypothetical protein
VVNHKAESEFWHRVGQRGQDLRDHMEHRKQTRRHRR